MGSYDGWKTRAPEDEPGYEPVDDREFVECDKCEKWIVDGAADNGRIGPFYLCPICFSEQTAVLEGRAREARADEARGK